jgi:hypothetical protein
MKIAVACAATVLLTGCAGSIRLLPVQGPLSTRASPPRLFVGNKPPTFTVTLEDGEVCNGDGSDYTVGTVSESPLAGEWDTVYGRGFFVDHVLGKSVHRTLLTCKLGATVLVENGQITPEAKASPLGIGVAKDSRGNIYKLTLDTSR